MRKPRYALLQAGHDVDEADTLEEARALIRDWGSNPPRIFDRQEQRYVS